MAVWIYKGDDSCLVEPHRLQAHLEGGWSIEKGAKPVEPEAVEIEAPSFEEADTNETGKLSTKEVRAAAKEAGIDSWKTARIKTLKQELGYE